ncbi:MAG: thiamine pyrophosphate-dependent enzyme, partial [Candidatus Dormibacteraeota bacterium]|nr:thiamine pyrophosphate-dependent enzyme [Candidatus Dormibacteraeota bacterium]
IGANVAVRQGLAGDARAAAVALAAELAEVPARRCRRTPETAERLRAGSWAATPYEDESGGGHIDPRTLTLRLESLLPAERTLAVDSGHFMGWPAMYMSVPDERGFVFCQAFQAVGMALANAIGAAVARPDRLAVAALGDGGALMGASELETAVRLGVSLLAVVYNDAAYGAEVHHFGPEGLPVDLVRFPDTDIAALARGAGAAAITVRSAADMEPVADWLRDGAVGTMLLDAKVVPTVVGEWLPEAFGH